MAYLSLDILNAKVAIMTALIGQDITGEHLEREFTKAWKLLNKPDAPTPEQA